jgi:hypothetical protein
MITYVNSVFVSNANATVLDKEPDAVGSMSAVSSDKGNFIIMNCDPDAQDLYTIDADTQRIKIGMVQGKNCVVRKADGSVEYRPMIKWSNEIRKHDIKSFHKLTYKADTEDEITIDFSGVQNYPSVKAILAEGFKRVIVKLTFKDLPTRYRKWTETYEYVTMEGDDMAAIATGIANEINGQWKRARVQATATGESVVIKALPYDDDDSVDSLNWANKVRFNASVWFTDPQAAGFASKNKYALKGAVISKEPGKTYPASAKLVRDREAQAMGYDGILNRGEGTWPIIKPAMNTDLEGQYDALTLEFENMYRAADDIFRKTKQTVEIYVPTGKLSGIEGALADFAGVPAEN